jgi:hypothetical protein
MDKVYFDTKSEFEAGPPQVSELLQDANVTFDLTGVERMLNSGCRAQSTI